MDAKILEDNAREYKVKLRKAMEPVLVILEEAGQDGFEVQMSFGYNWISKTASIQDIKFIRTF